MTIEKLERVLWRLGVEEQPPRKHYTNLQLKRAIMKEIGTDPRTYTKTRRALIDLQWIQSVGKTQIRITGKHITE